MRTTRSKMGFFSRKKKDDGGDGGSKDSGPSSSNPYAKQAPNNPYAQQPAASDPYANPSQSSFGRQGLPGGPRIGGPPRREDTMDSQSTAPPPYKPTSDAGSGYGKTSLGALGGYGGDRYNHSIHSLDTKPTHTSGPPGVAAQRNGGYGGLGDPEGQKRELFSGYEVAPQRRIPEPSQQSQHVDDYSGNQREEEKVSPEQQEEMEIDHLKKEIREERVATVNTGRRMLATLQGTKANALRLAERVQEQGERIDNSERNINVAEVHNRVAREQTGNLARMNRSIFLPAHLSKSKQNAADAEKLQAELGEKAKREELNSETYHNNTRMAQALEAVNKPKILGSKNSGRSKDYEFENGEIDEQCEAEIDSLTGDMLDVSKELHTVAIALNGAISHQTKQVERITEKTDNVDVQVRKNRMKLDRIR